jgi:hypothetical protein
MREKRNTKRKERDYWDELDLGEKIILNLVLDKGYGVV